MAVGEMGPDKRIVFYDSWKRLGEENAKLTPIAKNGRLAYDYSAYLALVCAVDAGSPEADKALKVVLEKSGGFTGMLADVAWRIVPRP